MAEEFIGIPIHSLIVPIAMFDNKTALSYQRKLETCGYLVGAIRQPTVKEPILRVIPRLGSSLNSLKAMLNEVY